MKIEPNNIYCGDCYELIKDIPNKSVDLIYTDIPYLIDNGGCSDNDLSKRAKRLRNEELETMRHGIDYSILDEFCRVLKRIYIYIYGATKIKYMKSWTILLKKVATLKSYVGAKLTQHRLPTMCGCLI